MNLIHTEVKPFRATAYHQRQFVEISEANLKGKWSVFFFYPADFSFICPAELGDLADYYTEFQRLGVEIYAVSTDSHLTHKAWHDSSDIIGKVEFPMLADRSWTLAKNFGVLIENEGMTQRGTFVVDPEGKIQIIELSAIGIVRSAVELLRKIKLAQQIHNQAYEICSATWVDDNKPFLPDD